MITMSFGNPKIKLGAADNETQLERPIFNTKNLILVGTGIALGIILKQQNEIHTLKRTVTCLQEIIR